MLEMDARAKAIGIITGGRVQALEDAGLDIVNKSELTKLRKLAKTALAYRETLEICRELIDEAAQNGCCHCDFEGVCEYCDTLQEIDELLNESEDEQDG